MLAEKRSPRHVRRRADGGSIKIGALPLPPPRTCGRNDRRDETETRKDRTKENDQTPSVLGVDPAGLVLKNRAVFETSGHVDYDDLSALKT